MQADPIGYKDGINCYAYVGNDPINKTDPSGMVGLNACTKRRVDCDGPQGGASVDAPPGSPCLSVKACNGQPWRPDDGDIGNQGNDGEIVVLGNSKKKKNEPQPAQNWCGSDGSEWVPDGNWGEACAVHDACCSNKGAMKEVCDLQLATNIYFICNIRSGYSNIFTAPANLY